MQDRYLGDVGDFGKFGLLRALCGTTVTSPLRLGVVWCLVPDESHNEDGKHTNYLSEPREFRTCDPELYDRLRELLVDDRGRLISHRRRVATIEDSGLFPPETVFFSDPIQYQKGTFPDNRLLIRSDWMSRALRATARADLVFVDPDNGIECQSVSRTSAKGPKYIYWDEIEAFAERGQTVIVYHHLSRQGSSSEQVGRLRRKFNDRMPASFTTLDVIFKRGTRRAYFIAAANSHRDALTYRLSQMLTTPWGNHFIKLT